MTPPATSTPESADSDRKPELDLSRYEGATLAWLQVPDKPTFIYSLNEEGTNRWSLSIQGGFARQGRHQPSERTGDAELTAVGNLIADAPLLLAEVVKLRAELAAREWQAVADQLPPEDENVLLSWGEDFPLDVGFNSGRDPRWNEVIWQRANDSMGEYDAPATHWMPLPTAPKAAT